LAFREALEKFKRAHPETKGIVLVTHSLGGVISHMQSFNLEQSDWRHVVGPKADTIFNAAGNDSLIHRALLFKANPDIKRVIFVAVPHRGANMAEGTLAGIAHKLITLPTSVVGKVNQAVLATIKTVAGIPTMPNIVNSLSPSNLTLKVMDTKPIIPPYHSILGNRGKAGPNERSSDGLVPYWSSHLEGAQSEIFVPGPHCCYNYPEATAEIRRILHLHLKSAR
jgi:hypothetical protein